MRWPLLDPLKHFNIRQLEGYIQPMQPPGNTRLGEAGNHVTIYLAVLRNC